MNLYIYLCIIIFWSYVVLAPTVTVSPAIICDFTDGLSLCWIRRWNDCVNVSSHLRCWKIVVTLFVP